MRVTRRDPSLAVVRARIAPLVAHARKVDDARRASAAKLAEASRGDLLRRRARLTERSVVSRDPPGGWGAKLPMLTPSRTINPDVVRALASLAAESLELARLESDVMSATAELERVASALRLVSLRASAPRAARGFASSEDHVAAMASELSLRMDAMREAERVAHDD
jgi:hypothetical protein